MRVQKKISGLAAIVLIAPAAIAYFLSAEQITLTVQNKDTAEMHNSRRYSSRETKFLVHTTDKEVFEVSTSYLFLEFRPVERYYALETGKTYRVIVAGWRIPFLNQYRNIVEILPDGGS